MIEHLQNAASLLRHYVGVVDLLDLRVAAHFTFDALRRFQAVVVKRGVGVSQLETAVDVPSRPKL